MNNQSFHENYNLNPPNKVGSNRKFGMIISVCFLVIALAPLLNHHATRQWALSLSLFFATTALLFPRVLQQINVGWLKLGEFLRKITTPIILFILFFIVFTPIALILKILKKDLLNLRFSKSSSYWIEDHGIKTSLKDQF